MNPAVATVLGAVVGGMVALVVALVNAWFGRQGRRADFADKITTASDKILDRLDKEIEKVEKRCSRCEQDLEVFKIAVRRWIRVETSGDPVAIAAAKEAVLDLLDDD